jgi:hypothetical protein
MKQRVSSYEAATASRVRTIRSRPEVPVAIRFRSSGCMFSIVASIVLTVVLNLLLRSC